MIQLTPHRELGGCRGYDSVVERDTDIEKLKEEGFDHFTTYCDTNAPIALCYGKRVISDIDPEKARENRHWSPKPGNRGYDLLC